MKTKFALTLGIILSFTTALRAIEALQEVEPLYSAAYVNAETGFCFKPVTNFTVTSLGFRFGSNTNDSYVVKLVDAEGMQLASVTLNAAAAPITQLVYKNIPALELAAGSTNYLLCYDAVYYASNGVKRWANSLISADDPSSGSFTVAAEILYLGACLSTNLVDPTNAANFLYVGPNFQFTTEPVVEPSYLLISLTSSNSVQLIWPASDTLGQLESATNLTSAMTVVTNERVVVGTSNVVELPLVPPQAYFRLRY